MPDLSHDADADVVVVGAGPTGLLLAGDLAAAGVRTTVLERRDEESNLTRAFAVHARTLEQLDARGIADDLVATGARVDRLRLFGEVSVDLSPLQSRFPFVLVTPQYNTERLLEKRAVGHGARVVRGAQVTGLRQQDHTVEVDHHQSDDASTQTLTAYYLVGTDGHHSVVREALGLPFPGESVVSSLMLADVRLSSPPADVLTVNGTPDGFCFVVPYGDGWYRAIARKSGDDQPDSAPVELDEIAEVCRTVLGSDFGMHSPRWISRFHSEERQVPRYRLGRVFLAGDAAHVHSPAGGQGMNTGMQDAANLGWKLAATVRGWGDDLLLDSYHEERHPVGREVLRASGGLLRAAMTRSRLQWRVRNTALPLALRVPRVRHRVRAQLSGIGISYPAPSWAHRLVGTRAPDIPLAGGARLYTALRPGRFVLVGSTGLATDSWAGRVDVVEPLRPADLTLLIRPDGYVAWAGSHDTELEAALRRWAGTPRPTD